MDNTNNELLMDKIVVAEERARLQEAQVRIIEAKIRKIKAQAELEKLLKAKN